MVRKQANRRLLKIALPLASFLVTPLLTEGVLRATGRFRSDSPHTVSAKEYERIPGMRAPSQELFNNEKPARRHHVRTNSLGLRGPETTLDPHKPRILCIGDSFTYGAFVDNDETLPAQIQGYLGEDFEVLNGGHAIELTP